MTKSNPTYLSIVLASLTVAAIAAAAGCTVSTPHRRPLADASNEPVVDAASDGPSLCNANQPLRCDKGALIRCNGNGTAEVTESCPLGCIAADLRCAQFVPSNGLSKYLEMATAQSDLNLGDSAEINTDTGEVKVGGVPVAVYSDTVAQSGAPTIRVLAVRSLVAKNVTVSGNNALAVVSSGDVQISGGGVFTGFTVSGRGSVRGPGAFGGGLGMGGPPVLGPVNSGLASGGGGGGFGAPGGKGGTATNNQGTVPSYGGGITTGNETLEPLRGGSDGGGNGGGGGGGGGALQLVSGSRIVIMGAVAASGGGGVGSANSGGGGGSGGGILLEAPLVEISGNVAANGGGGSGCGAPSDGGFYATPARGTAGCQRTMFLTFYYGAGGNGGAGFFSATEGESMTLNAPIVAGYGGGGVGRIRVNTASGDFVNVGTVSPNASKGTVVSR